MALRHSSWRWGCCQEPWLYLRNESKLGRYLSTFLRN